MGVRAKKEGGHRPTRREGTDREGGHGGFSPQIPLKPKGGMGGFPPRFLRKANKEVSSSEPINSMPEHAS